MPDGAKVAEAIYASGTILLLITTAAWLFIRWEGEPSRWDRLIKYIMLRFPPTPPDRSTNQTEQRSYAAEPGREPSGTEDGNPVPDIVERLEALDDDQLLDILALLRDDQGEYRFAESRVAKFIPGRVEDRLTQVRDIRHTEKPLPPGRVLRVRDTAGERVIPFSEGRKVKG